MATSRTEDAKFWAQFGVRTEKTDDEKARRRATVRRYLEKHPGYQKHHWLKLKTEVLTHYGGGELACVHCGYDDIRALSVDHINGNGREDRKDPKYTASKFYISLRRMDFPEGFQTLCMNCQYVKRVENNELSQARKSSQS